MSALDDMKMRINSNRGVNHNRFVEGKLRSFHKALENSYQAEWITLNEDSDNPKKVHCLINPSRLTEEFDKKVISVDYDMGVTEGTVFYWDRTDKHWIVNLQQHTEEAYFRGSITRCDYQADVNGHKYWVYLRGPIETDISWSMKHGLAYNNLNYSILMHITKNKETLDYFSRFKVVKVYYTWTDDEGVVHEEPHRWQVSATDKYSNNNIIEVYLNEYNDNEMEDNMAAAPEEKTFEPEETYIDGPQVVHPFDENIVYTIKNDFGKQFVVNSKKVKIVSMTDSSVTINILTGKSGEFKINYGDTELNVRIESL